MLKIDLLRQVGGVFSEPHWPYLYWGEFDKAVMQAELLAEDWSYARLNSWGGRV